MKELADQPGGESTCPKRVWVMSVLSDDEILQADGVLPQGLEFHLSRCPRCRALAAELQAVTTGLAGLATEDVAASLLDRANHQAMSALANGAQMTGRVNVTAELFDPSAARWRWSRIAPLAAAAAIVVALGVYGLGFLSSHGAGDGITGPKTHLAEDTGLTPPTKDKPKAALARDVIEADRDPMAIPPAYRGDDCKGDDCVERAFVPRRGRRPVTRHLLDTTPRKRSTTPASDDP